MSLASVVAVALVPVATAEAQATIELAPVDPIVASGLIPLATAEARGDIEPARVGRMPVGWYALGTENGDYAAGTDLSRRDRGQGQRGATIHSRTTTPSSFALLQQSIQAQEFLGRRVRLSGFIKTAAGVPGDRWGSTAALWMRVNGPSGSESADYMNARPIRQDSDWTMYEVVLDVPRNAVGLTFGVLMSGPGQVWLDDMVLEDVGSDIALTGGSFPDEIGAVARRRTQRTAYGEAPMSPVNLDFNRGTKIR
ncbi:MAG TPA: hypothetical protein VLA09_07385 [Longimicrobiales bacterium]|nr:hypothetical protein [Longimicrobiales bacterium]